MGPSDDSRSLTSWDLFVLRHRKPLNLVIHFISLLCFYLAPVLSLLTMNPWYLAAFFSSGLIGAIGHYVSGDGGVSIRETTSSPTVIFYVPRLFYRLFRGKYGEDLRVAEEKYRLFLKSSGQGE